MKFLKYILILVFILGFAYLTTIEPEGEYFSGFATLIKDKSKAGAQDEDDDSLHNLNLQNYRPSFNPDPD